MSIHGHRKEYSQTCLLLEDVDPDPIVQFQTWYDQAAHGGVADPNIMALATATADGRPSVRMVLLRGVDPRGFHFFTNYQSRKAREIDTNPRAALVFFWPEVERQVRVEGRVERTTESESDRYFHSRPKGARIGAWASPQSEVVASRDALEAQFRAFETQFTQELVPRPANWGGYRVGPDTIEFWQGRPNRLHDRLRYAHVDAATWQIERLAP